MRIAFDQQVFLLQEYGGISRYICSLAEGLSQQPDTDVRIFAPLHFNRHLEQIYPTHLTYGKRIPRIPKTGRLAASLSTHLARLAIKIYQPDIVHESYFSVENHIPARVKRVVTIYDMIHERFSASWPGSELTTAAKKASVMRADHVICISESTRRDLLELFGVSEQKVSVVYLGYSELAQTQVNISCNIDERPYLLYVGSRGGYKNFSGLLRAYASSARLVGEYSLVCFGGGAFTPDEYKLIQEVNVPREKVVQIGGGDSILARLYLGAAVLVYPSLYEGFGIPPLEAMSLGCPVACSNTSSIPEVVGDAGEYFDPSDMESMRIAIEAIVESTDHSKQLVAKGHARRSEFSWQRCASETLDVYRSIL